MKSNNAKKLSISIAALLIVIGIIALIVASLFSLWTSGPQPRSYVIEEVFRNDNRFVTDCESPYITAIKDITTETISYECGNLGNPREVIFIKEYD